MGAKLSILATVVLAASVSGCATLEAMDLDRLPQLLEQWEEPEEHVWGEGCVFDNAKAPPSGASQANETWPDFSNPWVLSGIVAAAIAIPVAVEDGDDDFSDPNGPLEVNDVLRAACLDTCYLASDEEIEQLLIILDQHIRDGGGFDDIKLCDVIDETLAPTGREEFLAVLPSPREACEECQAALVDYIYLRWISTRGP